MGLFSELFQQQDERPGPGVSPDEPRKKGLRRLWEVCERDIGSLFMAGLLALAGALPYYFAVRLALLLRSVGLAIAAGLLGGAIAFPQICGLTDTVLRGLRDEPGYWWTTYRQAWKRNTRACLLPGAVLGLLLALEALAAQTILEQRTSLHSLWGVALGLVVLAALLPYFCAQLVLFQLPLRYMIKNSLLLCLANLPRSLGAAALLLGYFIGAALLQPASYVVLILGNFWLPAAAALLAVYRPMEQVLGLENAIRKAQQDKRAARK